MLQPLGDAEWQVHQFFVADHHRALRRVEFWQQYRHRVVDSVGEFLCVRTEETVTTTLGHIRRPRQRHRDDLSSRPEWVERRRRRLPYGIGESCRKVDAALRERYVLDPNIVAGREIVRGLPMFG